MSRNGNLIIPFVCLPPFSWFAVVSSVKHISDHCGVCIYMCVCECFLWWWTNTEDKHISELSWCYWSLNEVLSSICTHIESRLMASGFWDVGWVVHSQKASYCSVITEVCQIAPSSLCVGHMKYSDDSDGIWGKYNLRIVFTKLH